MPKDSPFLELHELQLLFMSNQINQSICDEVNSIKFLSIVYYFRIWIESSYIHLDD